MVASGVGPGEHGESTAIWIINLLAAVPHQIRGDAQGAVPSPDGSLIAFRSGNSPEIAVIDTDGGNYRKLAAATLNENFGQLQWSPDGTRLGVIVRRIGDPQGTIDAVDLASGKRSPLLTVLRPASFVWLADGRMIVASSSPEGTDNTVLHEFDSRGRETPLPIGSGNTVAQMSATADGTRLVLVRQSAQADAYVAALSRDGTLAEPRRITLDDRDDLPSGWQPSGQVILFSSRRNGSLNLYRQRLDSPTAEQLAFGPEKQYGGEVTSDGKALFYWASAEGAAEARLMKMAPAGGSADAVLQAPATSTFHCAAVKPQCILAKLSGGALELSSFDAQHPNPAPLRSFPIKIAGGTVPWSVDATATSIAFADSGGITILGLNGGEGHVVPADQLGGTVTGIAASGSAGWYVTTASTASNQVLFIGRSGVKKIWNSQRPLFSPALSPDGKNLLFGLTSTSSNAWLIEHF